MIWKSGKGKSKISSWCSFKKFSISSLGTENWKFLQKDSGSIIDLNFYTSQLQTFDRGFRARSWIMQERIDFAKVWWANYFAPPAEATLGKLNAKLIINRLPSFLIEFKIPCFLLNYFFIIFRYETWDIDTTQLVIFIFILIRCMKPQIRRKSV